MAPALGRIVLYKLNYTDAANINRRRQHARDQIDYHRWKKNGTMVHAGNDVKQGDVAPMMIVAVWGSTPESCVNGKVMLDGTDELWVTSVSVSPEGEHVEGKFVWPSRV